MIDTVLVNPEESEAAGMAGNNSDDEEEDTKILATTKMIKHKYMSNRVRCETTTTVFRAVKFLNTPKLLDQTMEKLGKLFKVLPTDLISWKILYQKEVVYALNNKRNSVYQDVKPIIKGMFLSCPLPNL